MTPQNVIDMLESRGVIDSGVAEGLTQDCIHNGKEILQTILDYGIYRNEDEFWAVVAEELGADHFDLSSYEPPPSVINLVPAGMARLYGAFPITLDARGLHVAYTDPLNPQLVEDLCFGLGKQIVPVVARRSQVQALIDKHYGSGAPSVEDIFGGLANAGKDSPEVEANSAPIVKFVDLVMTQAIKEKASDIHFEPFEHEFKIRYRVDGALYEMAPPPVHLANSVISRVKVMANMNIAERRVPQDGRIMTVVNGKPVAAKARIVLQPGDVITYETPGGGGMGLVAERDPAAIARDIKEGYVTP
jgi:type IV pilus assembly protein PilB